MNTSTSTYKASGVSTGYLYLHTPPVSGHKLLGPRPLVWEVTNDTCASVSDATANDPNLWQCWCCASYSIPARSLMACPPFVLAYEGAKRVPLIVMSDFLIHDSGRPTPERILCMMCVLHVTIYGGKENFQDRSMPSSLLSCSFSPALCRQYSYLKCALATRNFSTQPRVETFVPAGPRPALDNARHAWARDVR